MEEREKSKREEKEEKVFVEIASYAPLVVLQRSSTNLSESYQNYAKLCKIYTLNLTRL